MEELKKKIDWSSWKKKCPTCNSTKVKALNTYKRANINTKFGWKIKELQLIICEDCGKKFWR